MADEFSQVMIVRGSGNIRAGAVATLPPVPLSVPLSPVTCVFTVTVAAASGRQSEIGPAGIHFEILRTYQGRVKEKRSMERTENPAGMHAETSS